MLPRCHQKISRISTGKFRNSMDIFAILIWFWEVNIISYEASEFLRVFVWMSVCGRRLGTTISLWEARERDSVVYVEWRRGKRPASDNAVPRTIHQQLWSMILLYSLGHEISHENIGIHRISVRLLVADWEPWTVG
jgi:hypothetical protein